MILFRRKPKLNPNSLASVMQAIYREHDVPHEELVKLRRKAEDTCKRGKYKVSVASVAMVMLRLLQEGRTVKYVRMLSHKNLLSWAIDYEAKQPANR